MYFFKFLYSIIVHLGTDYPTSTSLVYINHTFVSCSDILVPLVVLY